MMTYSGDDDGVCYDVVSMAARRSVENINDIAEK